MARLKTLYYETIVKKLLKHKCFNNIMEIPNIKKITLNMGVGEASNDKKIIERALIDLSIIAGQRAVSTKARKSISGFKIREGGVIGCKVTLRGNRMYEFLDRLLSIALPRVRDFRGLSVHSFDGRGNYSLGIKEQIVFPEIRYDKIDILRGFDITITTSSKTNEDCYLLLKKFKFPFKASKLSK